MAFTYTTLKAALEGYLQQYDADYLAMLDTIIRQGEDRLLKVTNLPVFKQNATATMVPGSRFMPAPSDMLSAYALTVVDSDGNYIPLLFREPSLIYEMWGATATGLPQYYSLYNASTFLVGPAPDSSYVLEFQYFYRPPSIVDAGTSWLGTNAENALLYACLIEAYSYMKGDPEVMKMYVASFQKAVADLTRFGEGLAERDNFSDNAVKVPVPQ